MARGQAARSIAILGAGPAGLAAALFLHRQGRDVVVFERFETPKPVGSGLMLQPTGLAVLKALRLDDAIRVHGRSITRMFGANSRSGRVVLDVRYSALGPDCAGLAVHRSALFGVLHHAALEAALPFETGFEAARLERDGVGRPSVVDLAGRRAGPFDLVVDASGSRSAFAPLCGPMGRRELPFGALWASLPWPDGAGFAADTLEQRYRRADVIVGVLPVGRRWGETAETATFFWSLKPERYGAWRAAGLEAWKAEVLTVWPAVAPLLDQMGSPDDLILARYGAHTLRRPFTDRLAVIGDAAHSTSPQLGQGANMALLDAAALAHALNSNLTVDEALRSYARLRRGHVRFYQAMSAIFTPFYQSDSRILPALRDRLLGPMSRLPFAPKRLAELVSGLTVNPFAGFSLEDLRRTDDPDRP